MKRVYCVTILCLLRLTLFLSAETISAETIVVGREDRWINTAAAEYIAFVPGKRGEPALTLEEGRKQTQLSTDMLLSFSPLPAREAANNYTITETNLQPAEGMGRKGGQAALISRRYPGVTLQPGPNSLFTPGSLWRDATIEFWLNSISLRNGEELFLWESVRRKGDRIVPQSISVSIHNRIVVWKFENIFLPPDQSEFSLEIKGTTPLIPKSWSHHKLRFDGNLGTLEYLANGKIEAVTHSTPSGREETEFYLPYIGDLRTGDIILGKNFSGFMEDVRISKELIDRPMPVGYPQQKGRFVSEPFSLGRPFSTLNSINLEYSAPNDSTVFTYYRIDSGDWVPFSPGTQLTDNNKGRKVEIKLELYPDGRRAAAPVVESVSIHYTANTSPRAPIGVYAEPGDSAATIGWQHVGEPDVEGYLLFYGTEPGNYFGRGADLGDSPIDVGENNRIVLKGLRNGVLYFFAVAAYDQAGLDYIEHFSQEVTARPREIPNP